MYCKICGSHIKDGEHICSVCGWNSQSSGQMGEGLRTSPYAPPTQSMPSFQTPPPVQPAPPMQPPMQTPVQEPQAPKNNILPIIIIAVVFAVLIVGVLGYLIINKAILKKDEVVNATAKKTTAEQTFEDYDENNGYSEDRYSTEDESDRVSVRTASLPNSCRAAVSDEDLCISEECLDSLLEIASDISRQGSLDCRIRVVSRWQNMGIDPYEDLVGWDNITILIESSGISQINPCGYGSAAISSDTVKEAERAGTDATIGYKGSDKRVFESISAIETTISDPLAKSKEEVLPYYDSYNTVNEVMYVYDIGNDGLFVRTSPEKIGGKYDKVNNIVKYSSTGKAVLLKDDEDPFVIFTYGNWAYLEISKHGETIRGWSSLDYLTPIMPN